MEKLKAVIPLNFAVMSNPVNWVIVTLMVLLAGISLSWIMTATDKQETA